MPAQDSHATRLDLWSLSTLVGNFAGLVVGIASATMVSIAAWRYERRRERAGVVARLSIAFVVVQAVIGRVSQRAAVARAVANRDIEIIDRTAGAYS